MDNDLVLTLFVLANVLIIIVSGVVIAFRLSARRAKNVHQNRWMKEMFFAVGIFLMLSSAAIILYPSKKEVILMCAALLWIGIASLMWRRLKRLQAG